MNNSKKRPKSTDKANANHLKFPLDYSNRQPILKFTLDLVDPVDTDLETSIKSEPDFNDQRHNQNESVKTTSHQSEPEDKVLEKNVEDEEYDDDDDVLDELPSNFNSSRPKLRMERFLSIADISDEIVQNLTQKYNNANLIISADCDADDDYSGKFKAQSQADTNLMTKTHTEKSFDSKKTLMGYRDGSGISQEKKINIIRSILKDYNVETYIDKFTACDVTEIKLESYNRKLKPIRDRLMRLMNSDVIRLNDPKYMEQLSRRLYKSFNDEENHTIQCLQESEKKREKKLRLHGLLEHLPENDHITGRKSTKKP